MFRTLQEVFKSNQIKSIAAWKLLKMVEWLGTWSCLGLNTLDSTCGSLKLQATNSSNTMKGWWPQSAATTGITFCSFTTKLNSLSTFIQQEQAPRTFYRWETWTYSPETLRLTQYVLNTGRPWTSASSPGNSMPHYSRSHYVCRHFHNAIHMFVRSAAARDAEVSVQGWAGGGGVRRWEGCMGSACAFHPRRRWKPICSPDHNAGPEESRSAPPPTVGMWFPPHTHSHTGTEVLWNQSVGLFSCPVWIHLGTKCHV